MRKAFMYYRDPTVLNNRTAQILEKFCEENEIEILQKYVDKDKFIYLSRMKRDMKENIMEINTIVVLDYKYLGRNIKEVTNLVLGWFLDGWDVLSVTGPMISKNTSKELLDYVDKDTLKKIKRLAKIEKEISNV